MNALKLIRARSGLSLRRLAEKSGISAKTISLLENDRQRTTLKTLVRLADVLDVEVSQLLDLLDTTAAERGRKGSTARWVKADQQIEKAG